MRPKIAPQRGQIAAFAEIMARHAGHEVILVIVLPRSFRNPPQLSACSSAYRVNGVIAANKITLFIRPRASSASASVS